VEWERSAERGSQKRVGARSDNSAAHAPLTGSVLGTFGHQKSMERKLRW